MIEIVVGQVGSGKSYYATYTILKEIKKIYEAEVNGTKYKYKRIYTNIEGIKENKYVKHIKLEKLFKLYNWEAEQYAKWEKDNENFDLPDLNFKDLPKYKIEELLEKHKFTHEDKLRIYDNNETLKLLEVLNERSEQLENAYIRHIKPYFEKEGFTNCLIIIDEAHNFFKYLDKGKTRLVTYHRHYDEDFMFITQDLKMINSKIRDVALKTIKATNPAVRMGNKTFIYKVYSGGYISFRDTNLLETLKIKADPDVFKLYDSGGYVKTKTHLHKILIRVFIIWVIIFAMGVYFLYTFIHKNSSKPNVKEIKHLNTKIKEKTTHLLPPKLKPIARITQINNNLYIYKNKTLTKQQFKHLLKQLKVKEIKTSAADLLGRKELTLLGY